MYPLKKGKITSQAHVGLPEGTYEEEHGRKGFYGKVSHLYHTHPPTGWIRIEGKLRPHCFDCNKLQPTDQRDPAGAPVAFLGNKNVKISVSRRSEPMPFYFRNADGDELLFVHRGSGAIETDFGPLRYEKPRHESPGPSSSERPHHFRHAPSRDLQLRPAAAGAGRESAAGSFLSSQYGLR